MKNSVNKHKTLRQLLAGGFVGAINGLLGSGGGIVAVFALSHLGLEQKKRTRLLLQSFCRFA